MPTWLPQRFGHGAPLPSSISPHRRCRPGDAVQETLDLTTARWTLGQVPDATAGTIQVALGTDPKIIRSKNQTSHEQHYLISSKHRFSVNESHKQNLPVAQLRLNLKSSDSTQIQCPRWCCGKSCGPGPNTQSWALMTRQGLLAPWKHTWTQPTSQVGPPRAPKRLAGRPWLAWVAYVEWQAWGPWT